MRSTPLYSHVALVREHSPLVHCLANSVTTNFTANALLALGAAPAMVTAPEEAEEFTPLASALSVNLGTLDLPQMDTIRRAVAAANACNVPWVLDPVAVGVVSLRTGFAKQLLRERPAVIRGNASEIICLAGGVPSARGVDSTELSAAAFPAARELANATQCVVVVSGATDYVTDGARTVALSNGSPLMPRVSGTGCVLSAVVAAFLGASGKPSAFFDATVAAVAFMSVAGELAALTAKAPGSFAVAFLDSIATLDEAAFDATLRMETLDAHVVVAGRPA
ncbi:hydroxyethylthiazole kinase [Paraburkholderia dinghuensis]|uniref:Hydroxyethylthiazole kinase n=2 Tax=Paraburkholderia dinghuensis TaxID=2305225 RepID=A0A3N6N3D5_9BURK|nr:hydroxyethylthiazole kinase [Paraburkholderia dinghuensis]